MKDEATEWLAYADDNLASAEVLLDHRLWNPCLQNCQQAVEKTLKAVWIERSVPFRKTHHIAELARTLAENGTQTGLTEADCDLLDSIYLSSKYPAAGALPDYAPDEDVCRKCLEIARRVRLTAGKQLG